MFQVMGKQTATQAWQPLTTNFSEGMAIQDADRIKNQGIYEYVKVVDINGNLCYTA